MRMLVITVGGYVRKAGKRATRSHDEPRNSERELLGIGGTEARDYQVQNFFQDHEDRLSIHVLRNEPLGGVANPQVELLDGEHIQVHGFDQRDKSELNYVTGVVRHDRVSRGNAFLRIMEIPEALEDPKTNEGDPVQKYVFLIFMQGEQLKSRVRKICEGFHATIFHCPEMAMDRREILIGVATRLEDLETVLSQTHDHRRRLLIAASKNMNVWFTKVWKIKAIYHTLNLFSLDVIQKCLIAECWIPVDQLDFVRMALTRGTMSRADLVRYKTERTEWIRGCGGRSPCVQIMERDKDHRSEPGTRSSITRQVQKRNAARSPTFKTMQQQRSGAADGKAVA